MKRKLIIFWLLTLILIGGYLVKKDTYTYSNLDDQQSKQLLETLIPKTIPQKDLTLFWNTISDYNNMMKKDQLIKTKMSTSKIEYPAKELMDTGMKTTYLIMIWILNFCPFAYLIII